MFFQENSQRLWIHGHIPHRQGRKNYLDLILEECNAHSVERNFAYD